MNGPIARGEPLLTVERLCAGYGTMQVLYDVSLGVERGQSLCLVGPNGAGKSTALHAIYGMARIFGGSVRVNGVDVTDMPAEQRLARTGVAYLLQENSVFPDMTVEENLLLGGYLLPHGAEARERAEAVLARHAPLRERRAQRASVLSGGERRILEIARALIMDPAVLLIDEPSIGLEPRFIDHVFEILRGLQTQDGKTIILVEQNAAKGLAFADNGIVLVAGRVARVGTGRELLADPQVGRLFLGA